MNTTGCAAGYATDQAFQSLAEATPCGVWMPGFWIAMAMMSAVRLVAAAAHTETWLELHVRRARAVKSAAGPAPAARSGRCRRVPTLPALEWAAFASVLLTFLLLGYDLANYATAGSFALFTANFAPYAVTRSVSTVALLRLSARLVPFASSEELFALSRFDGVLRVTFVGLLTSIAAASILFVLVMPLDPQLVVPLGMVRLPASDGV